LECGSAQNLQNISHAQAARFLASSCFGEDLAIIGLLKIRRYILPAFTKFRKEN
jgi:hypothetical protein